MLQSFGDKVKGSRVLGYLIIGIISVPFALFGIQSYLGGNGEVFAAKVNDNEISIQTLDRETQLQKQKLAQSFGGKIPDAFNSSDLFKNEALNNLIKKEVLTQYLNQYHFAISDNDLMEKILADKTFLKDGVFDKVFYKAQISSLGYSIPQFEELVREYARLSQIQDGIINSAFVLEKEKNQLYKLKNQKRNLVYYTINQKDFENKIKISSSEINDYYEQNKTQYKHPEKLKADYIELTLDEVAKNIIVSEEDIKLLYENNKALYKSKEKRQAAHILIKVKVSDSDQVKQQAKNKIAALKKKVEAGESFENIAKNNSQDIGSKSLGGDLGLIERGLMVKPFEDVLFNMKKGEISEPVLTNFGYHIIYLKDIKTASIKPYNEVKKQLEKEIKLKKADTAFYDLSEIIASQSYETPDNLEAAADESKVKIKTTGWITKNSFSGIAKNAKVRKAIFSQQVLADRQNSELIELADNHIMVLRINEHQKAKQKTLQETSEVIKKELLKAKLKSILKQEADKLIANLNIQKTTQVKAINKGMVSRNEKNIDKEILKSLFKLQVIAGKKSISNPIETSFGMAIVVTDKIELPEIEKAKSDETNMARNRGNLEYSNWINALKGKSEVVINRTAFE